VALIQQAALVTVVLQLTRVARLPAQEAHPGQAVHFEPVGQAMLIVKVAAAVRHLGMAVLVALLEAPMQPIAPAEALVPHSQQMALMALVAAARHSAREEPIAPAETPVLHSEQMMPIA